MRTFSCSLSGTGWAGLSTPFSYTASTVRVMTWAPREREQSPSWPKYQPIITKCILKSRSCTPLEESGACHPAHEEADGKRQDQHGRDYQPKNPSVAQPQSQPCVKPMAEACFSAKALKPAPARRGSSKLPQHPSPA